MITHALAQLRDFVAEVAALNTLVEGDRRRILTLAVLQADMLLDAIVYQAAVLGGTNEDECLARGIRAELHQFVYSKFVIAPISPPLTPSELASVRGGSLLGLTETGNAPEGG